MNFIPGLWKEKVTASKFPYAVNSEVEAENILFKNSPERLLLLKWIYSLISGLVNDIEPKELAIFFFNLGILEGDPFKFVEGNLLKNHQEKVWSNLFNVAKMMKYSPEISKTFSEKHFNLEATSCELADGHQSDSIKTLDSLSLEHDILNIDSIISTLEEQVEKPVAATSENNIVLCKLKEYLNRLSLINSQIQLPESAKVKDQNDFGNYTADLCTKMQTLETILTASSNIVSSMRQLDKQLDDHLLKSEDTLKLVCKLKRLT